MVYSLNILRGFAAFFVLVFHFQMEFGALRPVLFWSNTFYLWVDMFFILSGFIMVAVYAPKDRLTLTFSEYKTFMWRRFARIYPLHLLTMLAVLAMAGLNVMVRNMGLMNAPDPDIFDGGAVLTILSNLLLVQAWGVHDDFTLNTVSWSISVEWAMYLLFPVLLLLWRKVPAVALLALCAGLYMLIYYVVLDRSLDANITYGLVRAFAGFVAGMAIYSLVSVWRPGIPVALALTCGSVVAIGALSLYLPHHWLFIPAFWLLIFGSYHLEPLINPAHWLARIGNWLGDISYALYLWHLIIIVTAVNLIEAVLGVSMATVSIPFAGGIALGLTAFILFFAHLTFHYFEKPARDWLRRSPSEMIRAREAERT